MAVQANTMPKRKRISITKLNLLLDLVTALAFVVELNEHFTGLRNHELIGVAIGLVLIIHIVLHWRWVVSLARHFFQKLFHQSRLQFVLNLAVFVDMLVLILTGIGISRTLGLNLGLARDAQSTLKNLHVLSSDLSLILVAVHVAIHWKWIVSNVMKVVSAIMGRIHKPQIPEVRSLSNIQAK